MTIAVLLRIKIYQALFEKLCNDGFFNDYEDFVNSLFRNFFFSLMLTGLLAFSAYWATKYLLSVPETTTTPPHILRTILMSTSEPSTPK